MCAMCCVSLHGVACAVLFVVSLDNAQCMGDGMTATNVYDFVQAITTAEIKDDVQCTDDCYTPICGAKLCNPITRSRLATSKSPPSKKEPHW